MNNTYPTLSAALSKIECLILEGYGSFKLFRSEDKLWNVIVNGEGK